MTSPGISTDRRGEMTGALDREMEARRRAPGPLARSAAVRSVWRPEEWQAAILALEAANRGYDLGADVAATVEDAIRYGAGPSHLWDLAAVVPLLVPPRPATVCALTGAERSSRVMTILGREYVLEELSPPVGWRCWPVGP